MVTQPDPAAPGHQQGGSLAAVEAQAEQGMKAYNSLVERITPWLFGVGSWIFGGLIAFTILFLAALIPARPVDLPIQIATTALALAFPLDVTGLVLLRLVRDMNPAGFEAEIARVYQEAALTPDDQQVPLPATLEAMRKRGTRNVLNTALGILTLSCILTLAGIVAALWHMAWWIAVAFGVMVFLCQLLAEIMLVTAQPRISAEERARRRRQREELIKQAKEQARQEKERARQEKRRR